MDNDYSDTEMCTGSTAVNGFEGAGLIKDCNTLLGLKGTLEGSGGVELDWDVDTSMSEWEGITVGGTPSRVTNLSLSSRSLYGSIPAALGDLTELTHLDLSANFFTTSKIPKELNDLTKLTYLSFDNCINCPSSEIPYLGGLTNLTELHLHANAYTGNFPEWLGKLTKLTHVELWGTAGRDPEDSDGVGLTGPIPDLSGLTELTYLSLNKNTLTGPIPDLSALTKLTYLALHENALTGKIPDLSNLRNLEVLILNNNKLSESIPDLSNLAKLTALYLHENALTGPIPDLSGLTELTKLYLYTNQLDGPIPDLSGLTKLQELILYINKLDGPIPDLSGLINLKFAWLSLNDLDGPLPEMSNLPALYDLDFSKNPNLTGSFPDSWGSLPELAYLWLHSTGLSGAIPTEWGNLPLVQLYLHDTKWTGDWPDNVPQALRTKPGLTLHTNRRPVPPKVEDQTVLRGKRSIRVSGGLQRPG